jgi:hypothetical protein
MTIKRLSETLTFNDDDKQIIATMKKVGVWREMKRIAKIGGGDIEQAKKERDSAIKQAKDKDAIEAITDAINQGNHKRLEIVDYAMKAHGVARRKGKEVIDNYTRTKKK